MKIKTSAIYIALLCVSLLLSLNSTSAQKDKSRSANKRKAASAQKPKSTPSPTPTTTNVGTFTLIDLRAAEKTVRNAIEVAVRKMSFPFKGIARNKLQKTNLPPPRQITISYTPTEVSITTDVAGKITTPGNWTPTPWTSRDGDRYQVSTKWIGVTLERTFKGDDGQRVNTYSLSNDGKTLTMQVLGTREKWPRLTQPLKYQLDYKRN